MLGVKSRHKLRASRRAESRWVVALGVLMAMSAATFASVTIGAVPASAATTNTLLYSADNGASWSPQVPAAVGATVLVRKWYNNGDSTAHSGVSLTASVPTGFRPVSGSTKVCTSPATTNPTAPDSSQDTCAASNESAVWSGQKLTVSPTNGLYGQPNTMTSGIMNLGQRRYVNINQCDYNTNAGGGGGDNLTSAVDNQSSPAFHAGTNTSNTAQSAVSCAPDAQGHALVSLLSGVLPLDIHGQRYLNLNQCVYDNTVENFTTIVPLPTTPFGAGTNASNTARPLVCSGGGGGYKAGPYLSAALPLDLLGHRYLNVNQCDFLNAATTDHYTGFVGNVFAPFVAGTNTSDTAQSAVTCGAGGGGYNLAADKSSALSLDLLDTARGAGFAQFAISGLSPPVGTTDVATVGFPVDHQLYPRASATSITTPVQFTATPGSAYVTSVTLRSFVDGVLSATSTMAVSAGQPVTMRSVVPVGLKSSSFVLTANSASGSWTAAQAGDVVSGDVFVVNGQSNAETPVYPNDNAQADAEAGSPWIRTVGGAWDTTAASDADHGWYVAKASGGHNSSGSIGSWALRMARDLVDAHHVPVTVVNGAQGGMPISWFEPDYVQAGDSGNNYKRLMSRLNAYNLAGSVKSVLYYQGESEAANFAAWKPAFSQLAAAWTASFPNLAHIYLTQIRTGCVPAAALGAQLVQEQQRLAAAMPKVQVMSTNGLNAYDGCHFRYLGGGYQELGHRFSALIEHDSYGGTATNATAPAPTSMSKNSAGDTITIKLVNATDPITVDAGLANLGFLVTTQFGPLWPSRVTAQPGKVTLTIPPGFVATAVSYWGFSVPGSWPWVRNGAGIGLLSFINMPIS